MVHIVSLKILKNVHFTFFLKLMGNSVFFVCWVCSQTNWILCSGKWIVTSLWPQCVSTLISKEFIQNENIFPFLLRSWCLFWTHTFGIWMRLPKSFTNTTLKYCFALIDCLNYVLSWFLIKIDTDIRDTKHVSDIYNMHGYLVIQINNEYKGLKVLIISGALCLQQ